MTGSVALSQWLAGHAGELHPVALHDVIEADVVLESVRPGDVVVVTVPVARDKAACAIDLSGRPFTLFEAPLLPPGSTGGFEHELTEEFFRALANAAKLTLHMRVEAGTNAHHMIEASFKAFARALRQAVAIDPAESGVPSTKGTLTA